MPRSYSSRAHTDTVCAFVVLPTRTVRALLPAGLTTSSLPGVPPDQHPLWFDLGRIRAGAAEAAGVGQHQWWAWGGAAGGGALGLWTGTMAGWLGGPVGALMGARAGAAAGRSLGGQYGRALSQASSRLLGTYDELIVAVPGVVPAGRDGGEQYNFVLGMFASSRLPIWGDETLHYGYRKQLAPIERQGFERYRVQSPAGGELLRAELQPAGDWRAGSASEACPWLDDPLLGALGRDGFALSWLERSAGGDDVRCAPITGTLALAAEAIPGLPAVRQRLDAAGPDQPWGCFAVSGQPTRVSYPEHRRLGAL